MCGKLWVMGDELKKMNEINSYILSSRRYLRALTALKSILLTTQISLSVILIGIYILSVTGPHTLISWAFIILPVSILPSVFLITFFRGYLRIKDDPAFTLLIEHRARIPYNMLISASQLSVPSPDRGTSYISQALVERLKEDVLKWIRPLNPSSLFSREKKNLKPILILLALPVSITVIFRLLSPEAFSEGLGNILSPISPSFYSLVGRGHLINPIEMVDINLTYKYPEYTGLKTRRLTSSTGDIQALPGTTVELKASMDKLVSRAHLTLNETRNIPASLPDPRHLNASFQVFKEGFYTLSLKDNNGRPYSFNRKFKVTLDSDRTPFVSIEKPGEDLKVKPKDAIGILYNGKDDYGITRIELVYELDGKQYRKSIKSFHEPQRAYKDVYMWELSQVGPLEGAVVPYYLGARDNDIINGPKSGQSQVRYLEVFSPKRHHKDVMGMHHELLEEMIELLSLELRDDPLYAVSPSPPSAPLNVQNKEAPTNDNKDKYIKRLLFRITGHLTKTITALGEDYLAFPWQQEGLKEVKKTVDEVVRLRKRGARSPSDIKDEIRRIEDCVLKLDDMIRREAVENIMRLGDDILAGNDSLYELISRMEEEGSILTERLREELANLGDTFYNLLNEMSKLPGEMPYEFLNIDAAKEMGLSDASDRINSLMKRLEDGDLEGIMSELKDLLNQMEALASSLKGEGNESFWGFNDSQVKELLGLFDGLKKLKEDQGLLYKESSSLLSEIRSRAMEKAREGPSPREWLRDTFDSLASEVKDINKDISSIAWLKSPLRYHLNQPNPPDLGIIQRMAQFDSLLPDTGLADLHPLAKGIRDKLKAIERRALPLIRKRTAHTKDEGGVDAFKPLKDRMSNGIKISSAIVEFLDSMLHPPTTPLEPREREHAAHLAGRQAGIKEKTENLSLEVDELAQNIPLLGKDPVVELKKASGYMNEAEGRLSSEDISKALGPQKSALEHIKRASEALKAPLAGARMGMGFNILSSRSLPQSGPYSTRGGGVWGYTSGRVEIPSPDEYKVPPEFRDDILKVMKEEYPFEFKEAVERYYEKLLK